MSFFTRSSTWSSLFSLPLCFNLNKPVSTTLHKYVYYFVCNKLMMICYNHLLSNFWLLMWPLSFSKFILFFLFPTSKQFLSLFCPLLIGHFGTFNVFFHLFLIKRRTLLSSIKAHWDPKPSSSRSTSFQISLQCGIHSADYPLTSTHLSTFNFKKKQRICQMIGIFQARRFEVPFFEVSPLNCLSSATNFHSSLRHNQARQTPSPLFLQLRSC